MSKSILENPLIELLVKLEQAKRARQSEIQVTAAKRLLQDSQFRVELLRGQFPARLNAGKTDITFSKSERKELDEFYAEERSFPDLHVTEDVHMAMELASGEIEKEITNRELEDFLERGGSFVDWHQEKPLAEYVLERVAAKISGEIEGANGRLGVFITRTIEGRASRIETVGRALDRLVRDGFADELLRDVWDRYPIESEIHGLPQPPIQSAIAGKPVSAASNGKPRNPRGRPNKTTKDKIDTFLEKHVVPKYSSTDRIPWKTVIMDHQDKLPKDVTPDALRKRYRRRDRSNDRGQ